MIQLRCLNGLLMESAWAAAGPPLFMQEPCGQGLPWVAEGRHVADLSPPSAPQQSHGELWGMSYACLDEATAEQLEGSFNRFQALWDGAERNR